MIFTRTISLMLTARRFLHLYQEYTRILASKTMNGAVSNGHYPCASHTKSFTSDDPVLL